MSRVVTQCLVRADWREAFGVPAPSSGVGSSGLLYWRKRASSRQRRASEREPDMEPT